MKELSETREKERDPVVSTDIILMPPPLHCILYDLFPLSETMKISISDAVIEVYAVKNHFC